MITVAVNLKEYFEKYKNKNINKKHKGIKKGTAGMNFDAHAKRIMSLHEHETVSKKKEKKSSETIPGQKWHYEND